MSQAINRNILKSLLILSFIVLNIILLFGLGSIFNYLSTGADRSSMIPNFSEVENVYIPSITWDDSNPQCKKKPDTLFLTKLSNDYFKALYSLYSSQKISKNIGLKDYFLDPLYSNINKYVVGNKKNNLFIESTSLSHNFKINYFSNDAQAIHFIDTNVVEYSRIYLENKPIIEKYENSTYEVLMKLENGKWKVRQYDKISTNQEFTNTSVPFIRKTDSTDFIYIKDSTFYLHNDEFQIKGINYYPQEFPWHKFWKQYDEKIIKKDIEFMHKAGLNTVRIFIPFQYFNDKNTIDKNLENLTHFVKTCAKNDIYIMVTLFDFYSTYQTADWTVCDRQLENIVKPFNNEPHILAWDIKNEPDLDFKNHPKEYVTSWINFILTQMRVYAPQQLLTIGWSNLEDAENFINGVDFISAHYYLSSEDFVKKYNQLKTVAQGKPIVIQEYGTHSYNSLYFPDSKTIWDQEAYYKNIHTAFKEADMRHYLAWTLYDFKSIPNEVVGKLPWRKKIQQNFGFIDKNGNIKPAFRFIAPNYDKIQKKKIKNKDTYNLMYINLTLGILLIGIIVILLGYFKAKKEAKNEEYNK